MAENAVISEFLAILADNGQEFLYTGEPAADCAKIRFAGMFQGAEVLWDATVMTLARYNALQAESRLPASRYRFIDIDPRGDTTRKIMIVLDLEKIDRPALLKTIIMVRKYKRLHTGRHEFGATAQE
jgi:hypothetical protein